MKKSTCSIYSSMPLGWKGSNIYTHGCGIARAFIFTIFELLNRNTSKMVQNRDTHSLTKKKSAILLHPASYLKNLYRVCNSSRKWNSSFQTCLSSCFKFSGMASFLPSPIPSFPMCGHTHPLPHCFLARDRGIPILRHFWCVAIQELKSGENESPCNSASTGIYVGTLLTNWHGAMNRTSAFFWKMRTKWPLFYL